MTVEYASLTAAQVPITSPVTPYVEEGDETLDVSTGVTYPAKAERARRNPKVALLFADPLGSGGDRPIALVQGLASVRDRDLQGNTDRYVRSSLARVPEAYAGQPTWLLRRLAWYFARIWIQVTPIRILWWTNDRTDQAPQEWIAPPGTQAPSSDPAPGGSRPSTLAVRRDDWRADAATAKRFPLHDLTVVGSDGFPLIAPVGGLEQTPRGFRFQVATGVEIPLTGPACLTAHTHDVPFTSQQNRTFVGRIVDGNDQVPEIEVQRLIPHWSIPSGKLAAALSFIRAGRRLRPLLALESARRGQPPPQVRLPPAASRSRGAGS